METKAKIRTEKLYQRDRMESALQIDLSRIIQEKCIAQELFQQADVVLLYSAFGSEADTSLILKHCRERNIPVCYPKILDKTQHIIEFFYIEESTQLEPGVWGIMEPVSTARLFRPDEETGKKIAVIMPGAAFGQNGARIGYGKGFYDIYLKKYGHSMNCTTIALAYELQMSEQIPEDAWDIRCNKIITEKRIYGQEN